MIDYLLKAYKADDIREFNAANIKLKDLAKIKLEDLLDPHSEKNLLWGMCKLKILYMFPLISEFLNQNFIETLLLLMKEEDMSALIQIENKRLLLLSIRSEEIIEKIMSLKKL